MLESDGLDPPTEKCVVLFQPIECGVQLRDNSLGLIGNDITSTLIFLYSIGIRLPPILCLPAPSTPQAISRRIKATGLTFE
jgi:hypothetical protein